MAITHTIEDVITGVQTLTLRPGDILVLLTPNRLTEAAKTNIRETLKFVVHDVSVLILEEGMTVARITKENA